MKKSVNGKIVDIKNIEIFERAAEGIAVNRTITNATAVGSIDKKSRLIQRIIDSYNRFYSSLPFPLYGMDTSIKYCSAGIFIKKEISDEQLVMWIDDGLYIVIDKEKMLALGFVNNSWGIVEVSEIKNDNTDIKELYEETGFEDFVWILASLFKGESTANYYGVFMPRFVEACCSQPVLLKWELSNILTFSSAPDRLALPENRIIELDSDKEYTMDIFVAGTRETREKQHSWKLDDDETGESVVKAKNMKVYGYDLYVKPVESSEEPVKPGSNKLKHIELYGINSLFCVLCTIKNTAELEDFDIYRGFIANKNFVFCVDGRVFIAKADKYVEAKEIARGVEIYTYTKDVVYIVKSKNLGKGIKKEVIYSYSVADDGLRLCRIQFSRI